MNRSKPSRHAAVTRNQGERIALFAVNVGGMGTVLALTLVGGSADGAPLTWTFLWSAMFLLLVRPVLGCTSQTPLREVLADSVILAGICAGVLVLVSQAGALNVSLSRLLMVGLSATVLGSCAAVWSRADRLQQGRYVVGMLLLCALPPAVWLGLEEIARVRLDWLVALSPVAAALSAAAPSAPQRMAVASAVWMAILAVLVLVWTIAVYLRRRSEDSRVGRNTVQTLLLLGLVLVGASNAGAQTEGAPQVPRLAARLQLGVGGAIIAGGWNPARLMVDGLSGPEEATLIVDGQIEHHVQVQPGRAVDFLVLIPQEQPVFELAVGEGERARSSLPAVGPLDAVSNDYWPGLIVRGGTATSGPERLQERAPGVKFLSVDIEQFENLPAQYLAQFPVVMLEEPPSRGVTQSQFRRLTEWLASRTLVLPPGSRVRAEWPGLRALSFEREYGYDVLNPRLLDLLSRPRVRLVNPDEYFLGPKRQDIRDLARTTLFWTGALLVGTSAFYVIMRARNLSWVVTLTASLILLGAVLWAGAWSIARVRSAVWVESAELVEGEPGLSVGLVTRFQEVRSQAAGGARYTLDAESGAPWVPVYRNDRQRLANRLMVSEGGRMTIEMGESPQLFVSTEPRLLAGSAFPTGEELRRLVEAGLADGPWSAGAVVMEFGEGRGRLLSAGGPGPWRGPVELGRELTRRTGGALREQFVRWWVERRPEGRSLVKVQVGPGGADRTRPTIHAFRPR